MRKIINNFFLKKPNYVNRHKKKNFLILAPGPSLIKNKDKIRTFIKKNDLVVVGVNHLAGILKTDYLIFTNTKKLRRWLNFSLSVNTKVFVGEKIPFFEILRKFIFNFERVYYSDDMNGFNIKNGVIFGRFRTSLNVAIGLALVMGCEKIFLAGADGYSKYLKQKKKIRLYQENHIKEEKDGLDDFFFQLESENNLFFKQINKYLEKKNMKKLVSITPTFYKINYDSKIIN